MVGGLCNRVEGKILKMVNDSQGMLSAKTDPESIRDRVRTVNPEDLNRGLVVGKGGLWLRVEYGLIKRVEGGSTETGLLLQHSGFPSLLFYSSSSHLPRFQIRTSKLKLREKNTTQVFPIFQA